MTIPLQKFLSPVTIKRLRRFRRMRLSWYSLVILVALYGVSLFSEFIANDRPLYLRYQGESYFPVFFFYPELTFVPGGLSTRPDYEKLSKSADFGKGSGNFMVFAPIPYGPYKSADPESLPVRDTVTVSASLNPHMATVNVGVDWKIQREDGAGFFFGKPDEPVEGAAFKDRFSVTPELVKAVRERLSNRAAPEASFNIKSLDGRLRVKVSLSTFTPRDAPPETIRLNLAEPAPENAAPATLVFERGPRVSADSEKLLARLTGESKKALYSAVTDAFNGFSDPVTLFAGNLRMLATLEKNEVRFPFPPTERHLMGLDDSGRDVLARILYGLRTSLTFALILVAAGLGLGTLAGAVQGYFGGAFDIVGQRFTEIWSALPFLYIMIFLGSVFGQSFLLLIFCYGIFNWIGISYYMRAEFLRLRRTSFVEAARVMGLSPFRIIFRHILPNALTPLVTFFPFSLVGAVGALAALDYLGFGLPPPTPSWGELLSQAQSYRWAWWLILYPTAALFLVMLLGVFVGEGVRSAFDPRSDRLGG